MSLGAKCPHCGEIFYRVDVTLRRTVKQTFDVDAGKFDAIDIYQAQCLPPEDDDLEYIEVRCILCERVIAKNVLDLELAEET